MSELLNIGTRIFNDTCQQSPLNFKSEMLTQLEYKMSDYISISWFKSERRKF